MVFVICSEYVCLSIVFIIMLVILGGVIEEKKKVVIYLSLFVGLENKGSDLR